MRKFSAAIFMATLLIMLGSMNFAAAASGVKYDTGEYSATTSQNGHFKFKIEAHTSTNDCGTIASTRCFIAITYPTDIETCRSGQPLTGSFEVPNGFVSATGNFSYHQALKGVQKPLIIFRARASGPMVTGTLREEEDIETGTTTAACDTGTVHWRAHRN